MKKSVATTELSNSLSKLQVPVRKEIQQVIIVLYLDEVPWTGLVLRSCRWKWCWLCCDFAWRRSCISVSKDSRRSTRFYFNQLTRPIVVSPRVSQVWLKCLWSRLWLVATVLALFRGINISRMAILVHIHDFIFTSLLASVSSVLASVALQRLHNYSRLYFHDMLLFSWNSWKYHPVKTKASTVFIYYLVNRHDRSGGMNERSATSWNLVYALPEITGSRWKLIIYRIVLLRILLWFLTWTCISLIGLWCLKSFGNQIWFWNLVRDQLVSDPLV